MPHDSISASGAAPKLWKTSAGSYHFGFWTDYKVNVGTVDQHENDDLLLKRVLDIAGAVTLLVFLSPLLAVVALLIKLSSPGPIIFKQTRPGKDLKPFQMLKFRTMRASDDFEREEMGLMQNGVFCKDENDSRITTLGRFLRRCSIDELPQLINVLRGEMSLVGPRPILNCEIDCFERPLQRYRFSVRPGLTGLWQVSGRSNTSDVQRLTFDLQYVKNWSMILDFKLLLRTIPAVLKCQGAK